MKQHVSKSAFKPKAFEYFRLVAETGKDLIITEFGKPVLKIVPYSEKDGEEELQEMRGLVEKYADPFEPVGESDWEALK